MPDHVIEDGCYLIRYEPIEQPDDVLFFEGTARVMRVGPDGKRNEKGELAAGADLYWRPGCQCDPDLRKERPKLWEDNDPTSWNKVDNDGNAIPIFPRKLYRYYLQITQIMEDVPKKNISLSISVYEFKQDTIWPNPGSRWVCLNKVTPQIGNEYFEGNVLDQDSGQIVGKLTMCKVSNRLRRATVVMHTVKDVNCFPGDGICVQQVIENAGLDFKPPFAQKSLKEMTKRQIAKWLNDTTNSGKVANYVKAFKTHVLPLKPVGAKPLGKKSLEDIRLAVVKSFECLKEMTPPEIGELIRYLPDLAPQVEQQAWTKAFEEAGWGIDLKPIPNQTLKPDARDGTWTIGELQQTLYKIHLQQVVENAGLDFRPPFAEKSLEEMTKPQITKWIDDTTNSLEVQKYVIAFKKYVPALNPVGAKSVAKKTREDIQLAVVKSFECLDEMTPREINELIKYLPDLSALSDPVDKEWVYHLLCVPRIEGFDRGVMFEPYGSDSENLPREGAAVAADWSFGDDAVQLLDNDPVAGLEQKLSRVLPDQIETLLKGQAAARVTPQQKLEKVLGDQLADQLSARLANLLEHQLTRALKDLPAKVLEKPPRGTLETLKKDVGALSPNFKDAVKTVLEKQLDAQVEERLKRVQGDQRAKVLGDYLANKFRVDLASVVRDQLKNVLKLQWPSVQSRQSTLSDVLEKHLPDHFETALSKQPKVAALQPQLSNALKQQLSEVLKEKPTKALIAEAEQIALMWGKALGDQLHDQPTAYFRVGVHEIGHAMGLGHNFKDDGFMSTTDAIADDNQQKLNEKTKADNAALQAIQLTELKEDLVKKFGEFLSGTLKDNLASQTNDLVGAATAVKGVQPFPALIEEHFQADDLGRLRFGPDVSVRPGTNCNDCGPLFGDAQPTPAQGLKLNVDPLLDAIPFGAPARIKVRITNTSDQSQRVPMSLGLYTGVISGSVVDPEGNERSFWPLKKWDDSDPSVDLPPYESRTYTMTLLRGPQKSLFPMAGDHRVRVRATWQSDGSPVCLDDQTTVHVNAPVDDNHRASALKILSTPDTLFSIAIIGDHVIKGNDAIESILRNPILGPHFAIIRAKLLLTGPNSYSLDPDEACDLINDGVVMSFDEIDDVCDLLHKRYQPGSDYDPAKLNDAVLCLQRKISQLRADGSIEAQTAEITSKRLDAIVSAYP